MTWSPTHPSRDELYRSIRRRAMEAHPTLTEAQAVDRALRPCPPISTSPA